MEISNSEKHGALAPPPPQALAVVQLRFNRGSAVQPRPFQVQPGYPGEKHCVQCLTQNEHVGGERSEGPADDTNPPEPTAMDEGAHPDTTTDTAQGGTHDDQLPRTQETEEVLVSIFDEPTPAAGQRQPTDGRLRDNESFNAFMASCRDGAPAVGQTLASAPGRAAPHRELAAPAQPSGEQRRPMSSTAEPQQRPKRHRRERTQIPTILLPTEQAHLPALDMHPAPAGNAPSQSSAAPSGAQPGSATPRPRDPSGTPHRDAEAVPTLAQLPRPTRDGGPGRTQRPPQEGQHTTGKSGTRSKGSARLRDGARDTRVTAASPTMTTQATPRRPNTEHADFPTLAAMRARSMDKVQHQQSSTGGAEQGTDEGMTESLEPGKTEAAPPPATRASRTPPRLRHTMEDIHAGPDSNASDGAPSLGTLAARDREAVTPPPPNTPQSGDPLGLQQLWTTW